MVDRLTDRQQQVLRLLQQGKSNQQILEALGIKDISTVRSHMTIIRRNMGGFPDDPIRSLRRIIQRLTWEDLEETRRALAEARATIKCLEEELMNLRSSHAGS